MIYQEFSSRYSSHICTYQFCLDLMLIWFCWKNAWKFLTCKFYTPLIGTWYMWSNRWNESSQQLNYIMNIYRVLQAKKSLLWNVQDCIKTIDNLEIILQKHLINWVKCINHHDTQSLCDKIAFYYFLLFYFIYAIASKLIYYRKIQKIVQSFRMRFYISIIKSHECVRYTFLCFT